jgi:ABC-2 type transport system permease protein
MSSNQVAAIVWKEWRETLRMDQGIRSVSLRILFISLFGVVLAWKKGVGFGRDLSTIALLVEFTILPALPLAPDSFAGERERHTLETLLASSVGESEILVGKLLAMLGVGVLFAIIACGVDIAVVGLRFGIRTLLGIDYEIVGAGLLLGALSAAVVLGIGILISMYTRTVRAANQILAYTLVGLIFLGGAAVRALPPSWLASIDAWRVQTAIGIQFILVILALMGFALLVLGFAFIRFKRTALLAPA